jgi:hypothetical protein
MALLTMILASSTAGMGQDFRFKFYGSSLVPSFMH